MPRDGAKLSLLAGLMGLVAVLAVGCASRPGNPQSVPVTILHKGTQCGEGAKGLQQVGDRQTLDAVYQRFDAQLLGDATREPPMFDFDDNLVLLYRMGRQPTAGYGLSLARHTAMVDGSTLELAVKRQVPDEDSIVAQVVTSPCLLVRLPTVDVSRIRLLDTHGQTLSEASLR